VAAPCRSDEEVLVVSAALRTIVSIVRLRPSSPLRRRQPVRPSTGAQPAPLQPTPPTAPEPAPRSRRRTAIIVGVLLVLAAGVAAALLLTMPTIEQTEPNVVTRDATPQLQLVIAHPLGVRADNVTATIDGDALAADQVRVLDDGALVIVQAPRLADGEHDARVQIGGVGVLQRTLDEQWSFTVDTTPPAVKIIMPAVVGDAANAYAAADVAVITKLPAKIEIDTEVGSTLTVSTDHANVERTSVEENDGPRRSVELDLPQGRQQLTLVARDEAGNITEVTRDVIVDTSGPALTLKTPRVVKDATLALPIVARDPHGVELQVKIDGTLQEGALVEQSITEAPNAGASTDDADIADEEGVDEDADETLPISGTWLIQPDERVYEGRHALEVTALDSLGNRRSMKRTIIVDSGEALGDVAGLRPGARGADVIQLHDALVEGDVVGRGALSRDARTRTYGDQTRKAVQSFQSSRGMDADGVAGPDTVAGLTLKIVIDRGTRQLTLYRLGKVEKVYGVAVGSPQYPTPAGTFSIQSMQKNPTWTPPDSDWAKDAEVIPPGPDNPLGTRWMAIAGTVGIHGTNNPASIGYSVSHGCIRMRIPEVEDLFNRVAIGTPVTVV
jgi:lipoprotein-anchoring transpeptidase ErfK/SrfK